MIQQSQETVGIDILFYVYEYAPTSPREPSPNDKQSRPLNYANIVIL